MFFIENPQGMCGKMRCSTRFTLLWDVLAFGPITIFLTSSNNTNLTRRINPPSGAALLLYVDRKALFIFDFLGLGRGLRENQAQKGFACWPAAWWRAACKVHPFKFQIFPYAPISNNITASGTIHSFQSYPN